MPSDGHAAGVLIFLLMLGFLHILILWTRISFFSLTVSDLLQLRESHGKAQQTVLHLLENPNRLLATLRMASMLTGTGILFSFGWLLSRFQPIYTLHPGILLLLIPGFVALSFLAEKISDKVIAKQARFLALGLSGVAYTLERIIGPMVTSLPSFFSFSLLHEMKKRALTLEEISEVLDLKESSKGETILGGAVHFRHTDVREILTPRMDVVSVEMSFPLDEVMRLVNESGYSRIPVYEKSLDQIRGILYVKDLLPFLTNPGGLSWQNLIRPAFFVPDTKRIYSLLREFQQNKTQIAVVVDEYGGTAGIVSMEDILEEIVGEIEDESDHAVKRFTPLGGNAWLFDAKISINDFCRVIREDESFFDRMKGEADTLAGLVLEMNGEIPSRGDELEYGSYVFKVERVDERKIDQIKVWIKTPVITDQGES